MCMDYLSKTWNIKNWCEHGNIQKLEETYIQRMPKELKEKFFALSADERARIIKALMRFHQVMEEETIGYY